jgi:hypothetical protein
MYGDPNQRTLDAAGEQLSCVNSCKIVAMQKWNRQLACFQPVTLDTTHQLQRIIKNSENDLLLKEPGN